MRVARRGSALNAVFTLNISNIAVVLISRVKIKSLYQYDVVSLNVFEKKERKNNALLLFLEH